MRLFYGEGPSPSAPSIEPQNCGAFLSLRLADKVQHHYPGNVEPEPTLVYGRLAAEIAAMMLRK
jgi:hypothetical protein